MEIETKTIIRRIADFICGGATGFCLTYGFLTNDFFAKGFGVLMIISFLVYALRTRILNHIDNTVKELEGENVN